MIPEDNISVFVGIGASVTAMAIVFVMIGLVDRWKVAALVMVFTVALLAVLAAVATFWTWLGSVVFA